MGAMELEGLMLPRCPFHQYQEDHNKLRTLRQEGVDYTVDKYKDPNVDKVMGKIRVELHHWKREWSLPQGSLRLGHHNGMLG